MAVSFSTRLTRSLVVSLLILFSWVLYTQHSTGRGVWLTQRLDWLSTGASVLTLLNVVTLLLCSGRTGLGRGINRWLLLLNLGVTGIVLLLLLDTLVLYGPYWLPKDLRSYLIATPFLVNIYLSYSYYQANPS